jgi:Methyltransferase domain
VSDQLGSPELQKVLEAERAFMPHDVYEVNSMLSYDERLLLHWAARTGPPGAIVDLGSFVGGSTLALASGAEHRDMGVFAYDRFVLSSDSERTWMPGAELAVGDSTLPVFEHNTRRVHDRLTVRAGDVEEHGWTDGPIGVLFIDITKSWRTADFVWRTFLPALVPGALVIQQDLAHWGHPWCAVVMEHLSESFDYLGWVWFSSAVYRCRRPISDVPVPMLERFTCDEMLSLIDRAAARVGEPVAGSIRMSAVVVLAANERFDEARDRVAQIRSEYDDTVLPHIGEGLVISDRWIDDVQDGRATAVD